MLSAHGELEQVVLFVRSITTSAITTLISNSPNLILLYIATRERLRDENGVSLDWEDHMDKVSKTFSYHKLLTTGDFTLKDECNYFLPSLRNEILVRFNTNLNSFWRLPL